MSTITQPAQAGPGRAWRVVGEGRRRTLVLRLLVLVAAAAFAVWVGYSLPIEGPIYVATTTLGVAAVVTLGCLALYRFEWFIWIVLLTRPILDLTKGERGVSSSSGQLATLMGAAVIVVGVVWIGGLSRERQRLPLGVISRALILLTATSLISVLHASDPVVSALQVARTTGAVVMFVVLEQLLRTRRLAMQTLVVCALSTLVPLIAGLVQMATGSGSRGQGVVRITGSFLHPNTFGFFLVMVLLMAYPLRRYVSRRTRWLLDALMVVCAVELAFTYSRGSWIVLAAGLLVVAVLAERRLFLLLPAVVAGVYLFVPSVVARVSDLASEDTVGGRPGNSASWRLAYLEDLLASSEGLTFFGIGPKMADRLTLSGRPPHNDAIRMFLENGIVGLVLYLAFLVGLVLVARRALRVLRSGFDRGLAVGFAATLVAFLLDSMGANLITQFVLLIYVLALAAIVQAWVATAVPDPAGTAVGRSDPPVGLSGDGSDGRTSALVQSDTRNVKGSLHGDP